MISQQPKEILAAAKELLKSRQTEARNVREHLEKTNDALTIARQGLAVTNKDLNTTIQLATTYLQKLMKSVLPILMKH